MAVCNNGGNRRQPPVPETIPELPVAPPEPVMRRWPHPTTEPSALTQEALSAQVHRLNCALSRQTHLLVEIRSLLEQLVAGR